MEPEVDNNMKKCIIYALSLKRVSDPAYGKDWLIDLMEACRADGPKASQCSINTDKI